MKVVLVIVSTLLALVNAFCFHGLWKSNKCLDDEWHSGIHFDESLITRPLDDVWVSTWPFRKYLDDVVYSNDHSDEKWHSYESDNWEYSPEDSTSRVTNCFVSLRRRHRMRWRSKYVYLVQESKTYHDAREYCEENDGNLVKIDGYNDRNKVLRLLRGRCRRDGDYWIGLNKLREDGRGDRGYYWDLDHSFPDRTYWWDYARQSRDCVAMVQEGNYDWSDRRCDQKSYFMCEYDHRLWN